MGEIRTVVPYLDGVWVTKVYAFVKTQQIVLFRFVPLVVYKFYLKIEKYEGQTIIDRPVEGLGTWC